MPIRATYLIGALIPKMPNRPKGLKEEMRNIDTSNHLYSLRKIFVTSRRQDGKL